MNDYVAPHPRIRQRRVEVRRDEGRRRLRILLCALGCVGVGTATYGVTRSPLLDVDHVDVHGAGRTPADAVVRAAGLGGHPPLADVDTDAVAAAVERLPWVLDAEVTRHFPNGVEVRLRERTPVAAIPAGGTWALVDPAGRVLERVGDPEGLTRVEVEASLGEPGSRAPDDVRRILALVDRLPAALNGRVPAVTVAVDGALTLRLDGRIDVLFGPAVATEEKIVALATLVEKADLGGVRTIDVRVPSAPVLTRT